MTLIEAVIYIALIAIILPALGYFIVDAVRQQEHLSTRIHVAQTSSLILDEMRYELQYAQAITVTASTLAVNPSSLRFTDRNGVVNTITVANDTYSAEGQSRTIKRLRLTQGATTSWMTGNEITVDTFNVNIVRNSAADLTAININLKISPLVATTAAQLAESLDLTTSIFLNSYVQEN